jgi:catechol-2,3-dioxygenase
MLMHYYETEHANISSLHLSVADTNAAAEAFFAALGYQVLPVKVMRKETCMK